MARRKGQSLSNGTRPGVRSRRIFSCRVALPASAIGRWSAASSCCSKTGRAGAKRQKTTVAQVAVEPVHPQSRVGVSSRIFAGLAGVLKLRCFSRCLRPSQALFPSRSPATRLPETASGVIKWGCVLLSPARSSAALPHAMQILRGT